MDISSHRSRGPSNIKIAAITAQHSSIPDDKRTFSDFRMHPPSATMLDRTCVVLFEPRCSSFITSTQSVYEEFSLAGFYRLHDKIKTGYRGER